MRFFSRRRAKEQEERPEAFVSAIIVAAGQSRRMGGDTSKQFILIDGVPVIVRTLKAFEIAEPHPRSGDSRAAGGYPANVCTHSGL